MVDLLRDNTFIKNIFNLLPNSEVEAKKVRLPEAELCSSSYSN